MRCDVDLPCGGAVFPQLVFLGFASREEARFREKFAEILDFFVDVRSQFVGNREDEVLVGLLDFSLPANPEDGCARALGHIVGIDQIF